MSETTPARMRSPASVRVGLAEASSTTSVLSYAILLGGFLTIAVALYMVVTSYSSLPFWDGWEEFRFAAAGGNVFSPAWLWRLHNEHRMVIPKLFLAADLRFFQARQVFLLASIFAIQLMHLTLLSWSMRLLGGWRGALWRSGTGLVAFCLFCPSQYENFVWSFQIDFVLPQLLATLSFVALVLHWAQLQAQSEMHPSPKFLVISILAALGATVSLASGNLLWPLLVGAALYLRLRIRDTLSYAVVGATSISAYLYHFVRPEVHANPVASLHYPFQLLTYSLAYFFNVWPVSGTRQGVALWVVIMISVLFVLPYVRRFHHFAIQLVLIMLYCLGTALITAMGRLNFGISQAGSSRYQTVALLFWCSVGLAWLGGAFLVRVPHSFLVAQFCLLAIFARAAASAKDPVKLAQGHAFAQKAATAALLTGVLDPVSLGEVHYGMELFTKTVPYMRANRLSVFSGSSTLLLGKSLDSNFSIADSSECSGALESVVAVDESYSVGLRMLGWARDRGQSRQPSAIVVTSNGSIVGLGATGKWVPYINRVNLGLPSRDDGFVAYAPELPKGSTLSVYAILHRSPPSACYIDRFVK